MDLEYKHTARIGRSAKASEQLRNRKLPVACANDARRCIGNRVKDGVATCKRRLRPLPIVDRSIDIEPGRLTLVGHRPRSDQYPERRTAIGLAARFKPVDLAGSAKSIEKGSPI